MRGLAGIAVVLALISLAMNVALWHAEKAYSHGASAMLSGKTDEAASDFHKAIKFGWSQPMFFAASALAQTLRSPRYALPSKPWEPFPPLRGPQKEKLREALVDGRKALELSPNDSCFWSNWAWLNALLGDDSSAQTGFEHAVAVDPHDIESRISLGLLMERHHEPAAALEQYAYAIAISPRILDSSFFQDLQSRWPDHGVAPVDRALDVLRSDPAPSPVKLAAIAKLDAQQGRTSKASREYFAILSQLPGLPYTWDNLGMTELSIGQQQAAYRDFSRAAALDGGDIVAANELASIDVDRGNFEEAEAFYGRTLLAVEVSVHAQRTWRIYHVPAVAPDDVLPAGLLEYVSPELRRLPICDNQVLWSADQSALSSVIRHRLYAQKEYCASVPERQVHP